MARQEPWGLEYWQWEGKQSLVDVMCELLGRKAGVGGQCDTHQWEPLLLTDVSVVWILLNFLYPLGYSHCTDTHLNSGVSCCMCNREQNWAFSSVLLRLEGWGSSGVWAALGQTPSSHWVRPSCPFISRWPWGKLLPPLSMAYEYINF